MEDNGKYITVTEGANLAGVSRVTLYKHLQRGNLTFVKASALSSIDYRVKLSQLNSSILRFKLPVNFIGFIISAFLPESNFMF